MCDTQRWHANADADSYSNGDGYSYINAQTETYAEVCANPKTPSHTSAETVEIFATSTIFNVPRRSVVRRRVTGDRCFSWPARTEWRTLTHTRERTAIGRASSPLHADFPK